MPTNFVFFRGDVYAVDVLETGLTVDNDCVYHLHSTVINGLAMRGLEADNNDCSDLILANFLR